MKLAGWIAVIFVAALSHLSFLGIARLWKGGRGFSERRQSWWLWGDPSWRGWVRAMPLGVFAFSVGVVAAIIADLGNVGSETNANAVATAVTLVLSSVFLVAMVGVVCVVLFNWPKFAVPAHLRKQPEALREWRKQRRREPAACFVNARLRTQFRLMAKSGPVPWWRITTLTVLVVAFIVAVFSGRTIEAVIVGLLMLPTLVLLGAWIYERRHRRA
jgi:hypothetical protein